MATSSLKAQIASQLLACSTILLGGFWRYTDSQIRVLMTSSSWSNNPGKTLDQVRQQFIEDVNQSLIDHGYKGDKNGYEEYLSDGRYNSTDDFSDTLLVWRAPDFAYTLVSLTKLKEGKNPDYFDTYDQVDLWLKELGFKANGKPVHNYKNGTECYLMTVDTSKMLKKLDSLLSSDYWAKETAHSKQRAMSDDDDGSCDCEYCRGIASEDDDD